MSAPTPEPRDALAGALRELRDDIARAPGEPADRYWLRVGLGLGLRRPGQAQQLLERLEGSGHVARAEVAGATDDAESANAGPEAHDEVPVRSMLLARAAVLPLDEPAETAFGWASRLTAAEIMHLGRVVSEQLAAGGPPDLARGFGLAWTAGTRIPNTELNALFTRFTELELSVASVLGGRDMRSIPSPKGFEGLSAAIQGWFAPRRSPADSAVSGVFEQFGTPAQRGLVAAWNAWAALRFRELLTPALFEQLVQPWTTVVGRLPEA